MASYAWAKIYCDLLRHPLLRGRPDCDKVLVLGLILEAKEHSLDGVLRNLTAKSAKGICNIEASVRQVQQGIDYLVSVHWLIPVDRQGSFEIRDFRTRQAADSSAERTARWRKQPLQRINGHETRARRERDETSHKRLANVTSPSPEVEVEKRYVACTQSHEEREAVIHNEPVDNSIPESPDPSPNPKPDLLEVGKALEQVRLAAERRRAAP